MLRLQPAPPRLVNADFLNLLTAIHQRLAVDIPDADTARLATIDGAVAYLLAKAPDAGA